MLILFKNSACRIYTYFYLTNKKIKSLGWSTWLQKQSTFRKLDRGQNPDLQTKYEQGICMGVYNGQRKASRCKSHTLLYSWNEYSDWYVKLMNAKQLLDEFFYRDLDFSGYHKKPNLIIAFNFWCFQFS